MVEQNPSVGAGFFTISGMNGLPNTFLSVQAGGADRFFAVATDETVWEHTPAGNTHVSIAFTALQISATETPAGVDEVFMTLTDNTLWEYSLALPGHFKQLLTGVASTGTPP